jgi:threonine dehydrogenase-like Zn-dependent dehydrogenase
MPELQEAIGDDRLRPREIISHRLKLGEAAEGYRMFDKKEDDCRKVIMTPKRIATCVTLRS